MKIAELRSLTDKELATKKREFRHEFFHLKLQQASGQLEKPSRLREIRRNVARLETALSEKRRAAATTPKE